MATVKISGKQTTVPTTAWLPPDITERLEATSKEQGVSKSEIIRLACSMLYGLPLENFSMKIIKKFAIVDKNA